MASRLAAADINVILVHIDEAHSSLWPVAIDSIFSQEGVTVTQPEPHKSLEDRVARAQDFIDNYKPPFPVFIDYFDNQFAEKYRAWPDRFIIVDHNKTVFSQAAYHGSGDKEAIIITDCTEVLETLLSS